MSEFEKRARSVGSTLPEGADAAIITSEVNLHYFTGFPCDNAWLIITREDAVFITDFRYTEAAQAKIGWCRVLELTTLRETLGDAIAQLGVKTALIERQRVTLRQADGLAEAIAPAKILPSGALDDIIASLRDCKSESELELIRASQAVTEKAFNHILGFIRPGMTEREIALELEFAMRRFGASRNAFDLIIAAGENGSMPHAVPGDRKVAMGDMITIDMGAVVDGYHSDMTRTFALGKPCDEMVKIYETVLRAQEAAVVYLENGGIGRREADAVARDIIYDAGYKGKFGHSLGHGVGLEIHETPNLAPSAVGELMPGNVVTVEPGIYVPGLGGVRIEDMVYITESSAINLTTITKELIIL